MDGFRQGKHKVVLRIWSKQLKAALTVKDHKVSVVKNSKRWVRHIGLGKLVQLVTRAVVAEEVVRHDRCVVVDALHVGRAALLDERTDYTRLGCSERGNKGQD